MKREDKVRDALREKSRYVDELCRKVDGGPLAPWKQPKTKRRRKPPVEGPPAPDSS